MDKHREEEIWFSSVDEKELAKYDKDAAFAAFQQRVADAGQKAKKTGLRWLMYAAAVALLLIVSYASYWSGQQKVQSLFADIVIEVPQGSRTEMILPDGTKVCLNAGSRMTYSQGFGYKERKVSLSGEGYFEVTRNENYPFSVTSGHMEVKVLGTKFNFRDYPTDAETIVTLYEGSVALHDTKRNSEDQLLKPDERAILNKETGEMTIENCESKSATAWTNGKLIFEGETLWQIAKELERSYNVVIIITDEELAKMRFYGDFLRQEQTLKEVLDALAATGKLHYKIEEKQVIIEK